MRQTKYGAIQQEIPPYVMREAVRKIEDGGEFTESEAIAMGYIIMFAAINKRPFDPTTDMPKRLVAIGSDKSCSFDADGVRIPFNQKIIDAYFAECDNRRAV